jgi:hypothetical protein
MMMLPTVAWRVFLLLPVSEQQERNPGSIISGCCMQTLQAQKTLSPLKDSLYFVHDPELTTIGPRP